MEKIKIGDACDILNGFAFKSDKYVEDGIRVIRIANVQKGFIEDNAPVFYPIDSTGLEKYMLKEGDLLMSLTGNVGRVAILQSEMLPAALNQRVACLRIKTDRLTKGFLFHILNSDFFEQQCIQASNGVAQKNMSTEWLKDYEIPLYSIEEQLKITEILDKARMVINSRTEELRCLDELIKARFVELFGNCKEKCKLSEYAELITKGASPRWQGVEYSDNEEGTLFVTSENVREGFIDYSKRKYLPNEINDILPRSVLKRNDVLINIVNASIGRAAIYESDDLANINQAVALVRLKPDSLNLKFLLAFLNSDEAIRAYDYMKVGGDKANLSLKNISDLQIPVADMSVQNQFADFTKQVDKSKVAVQKSLDETQLLFDSMMQKYFG